VSATRYPPIWSATWVNKVASLPRRNGVICVALADLPTANSSSRIEDVAPVDAYAQVIMIISYCNPPRDVHLRGDDGHMVQAVSGQKDT
jgi:hypothetical protein